MSWVIGVKRKNQNSIELPDIEKKLQLNQRYRVRSENHLILAGGLKDNCLCSLDEAGANTGKGWIVCGLGISYSNDDFSILNRKGWNSIIESEQHSDRKLNGGHAIVRWNKGEIQLFTDQLGLRKMFIMEDESFIYFSSRLDWLCIIRNGNSIDYANLSSFWMLNTSYVHKSFVKDIQALGSASRAILSDKISIHSQYWEPDPEVKANEPIERLLEKLILLPFKYDKPVSLGLSGGIDSRTILAVLLKNPGYNWVAHTFGEEEDPDVVIARQLCRKYKIMHSVYDYSEMAPDTVLKKCREFSLQAEMSISLTAFEFFMHLNDISEKGYWVIDGGWGELLHRACANKAILQGKKYLFDNNMDGIESIFHSPNPPIFNKEIINEMQTASRNHLKGAVEDMPDVKEFKIDNWFDLLTIRYKYFSYAGAVQALYDSCMPNYMPLAQPLIYDLVFNIPISVRKQYKINSDIINNNCRDLAAYPLARYSTTIPYSISSNLYISYLWAKVKQKSGRQYISQKNHHILSALKEHILDRVSSSEVKNFAEYDYKYIKNVCDQYYFNNKKEYANSLLTWLSFDFWREIL